jgi:hypothetical protein
MGVAFVIFMSAIKGLIKKATGWKFQGQKLRNIVEDPAFFMSSPLFACVIQTKHPPVTSVIHHLPDVALTPVKDCLFLMIVDRIDYKNKRLTQNACYLKEIFSC